jgi:crotonobetainyl-CoA:carnitine CoA-transferase CaiB-like acyl-CoA transferase
VNPKRSGTQHPQICPTGVFRAPYGYVIIMAILDHQWRALCEVMGSPELVQDPRFATNALRVEHRDELVARIERWLASMVSMDAAIEALRKARIPNAPILSIEQAVNHPHHRARGTVRTIEDRFLGTFEVPGFPLRFSAYPDRLPLDAPVLGENNAEILSMYLGYDAGQIAALEASGVLARGER